MNKKENSKLPESDNLLNPKNTDQSVEEVESSSYHYKWMIALLIVGIIGSFVFKFITK